MWRRHLCRWRAKNFDLCSHLWPLSNEGSLTCHTYCDTGHPFIMVIFEDPWHSHLTSNTQPSAYGANALIHCATTNLTNILYTRQAIYVCHYKTNVTLLPKLSVLECLRKICNLSFWTCTSWIPYIVVTLFPMLKANFNTLWKIKI